MNLYNRLRKLRPLADPFDYGLQDDSDGNGVYIREWTSPETQPTQDEIDSVDDSPYAMDGWNEAMVSSDGILPRWGEDLYDALNPVDQANASRATKDKVAAKKLLRSQRP
jgi:hypothetical protein